MSIISSVALTVCYAFTLQHNHDFGCEPATYKLAVPKSTSLLGTKNINLTQGQVRGQGDGDEKHMVVEGLCMLTKGQGEVQTLVTKGMGVELKWEGL